MTNKEIVQALRLCSCEASTRNCPTCPLSGNDDCVTDALSGAADIIERLTAEGADLRKELEWKDMVISLAQRKQAEAEAERDALLGKWISGDDDLPAPGMRVLATDGVFVGEAYRTSAGTWNRYDGVAMRDCIGSVVTHWIPLPSVPKKGEQNAWKSETES